MHFFKYDGTGNDFIIIDNHTSFFPHTHKVLIQKLCDRRHGIGADGLMLLERADGYDFKMVYYNADGGESTMCGNGGRCISHFAKSTGRVMLNEARFIAIDGEHTAMFMPNGDIALKMNDVLTYSKRGEDYVVHTGSPHYVCFTRDVAKDDIVHIGREIRYNAEFKKEGINVNIASNTNNRWYMRTYERGVEDETLSCGTGTVAVAMSIALEHSYPDGFVSIDIYAPGGILNVHFEKRADCFKNVYLTGAVKKVYEGDIDIN